MSAQETCWCEHVDIGVGMQKVAHNDECPVCNDPTTLPCYVGQVLFSGDTHGDIDHVRWLIKRAEQIGAHGVFVLGDFGIWSHLDGGNFVDEVSKASVESLIPVFFLPGNHENYDLLDEYERDNNRTHDGFVIIKPGVLYSPRGHRWTWNGVRFLSLGGAYSIDKQPRVVQDWALRRRAEVRVEQGRTLSAKEKYSLGNEHVSWWPQEEITEEERDRAMEGGEVDVMLTHDKPLNAHPDWNRKDIPDCHANQEKIQAVVDVVKPKLLLHGHLHYAYEDFIAKTETVVRGLDCDPEASRYSGGSGMPQLSMAILDMDCSRPPRPEPGADEHCYSLRWFEGPECDELNRDFERKEH